MINIPFTKLNPAAAGALAVVVWLTAAGLIWGCGKKGPPEPPSGNEPPKVSDLSYSISENTIKLSWTIPPTNEKAKTPVTGFLIYQYKQPANERECPNCPVIFKKIGDVPARGGGRGQSGVQPIVFVQTIEPGYRYIYKVRAYNNEGIAGRDSNFVEFLF